MNEIVFENKGFSLERLRLLCNVARMGGIRAAVGDDPVRQSLASRQLKELSEYANVELTKRIGRGIDESLRRADSVAEGIGDASERIADVQERSRECEEIVADSERRIAESKSIIQAVRSREGQNGK